MTPITILDVVLCLAVIVAVVAPLAWAIRADRAYRARLARRRRVVPTRHRPLSRPRSVSV